MLKESPETKLGSDVQLPEGPSQYEAAIVNEITLRFGISSPYLIARALHLPEHIVTSLQDRKHHPKGTRHE